MIWTRDRATITFICLKEQQNINKQWIVFCCTGTPSKWSMILVWSISDVSGSNVVLSHEPSLNSHQSNWDSGKITATPLSKSKVDGGLIENKQKEKRTIDKTIKWANHHAFMLHCAAPIVIVPQLALQKSILLWSKTEQKSSC